MSVRLYVQASRLTKPSGLYDIMPGLNKNRESCEIRSSRRSSKFSRVVGDPVASPDLGLHEIKRNRIINIHSLKIGGVKLTKPQPFLELLTYLDFLNAMLLGKIYSSILSS